VTTFDNHPGSGPVKDTGYYERPEPVTPDQVERARLVCAYFSENGEELDEVLDMLNIGAGWPDGWGGPVGDLWDLNRIVR
jgi:hypothetical protein